MQLNIKAIDGGFCETFSSQQIQKVVCTYDGKCRIYYYTGKMQEILLECSSFNQQYGFPISETHSLLFASSWENGLSAYDISSGLLRWTIPIKKASAVIVMDEYLMLLKNGSALLKIDIASGSIIAEIKSKTIEHIYELRLPYVLLDRFCGRLSILNSANMEIVKTYTEKQINPRNCLSFVIQNVQLENESLVICGFEDYPNRDFTSAKRQVFCRTLGNANLK